MDQDEKLNPVEMGNEPEGVEEEDFAELLKQSFVRPERLEPGRKVKAKVIKITSEWVFLDLGGKSEGYLSTREVLDDEGNVTAREGEELQAYFLSSEGNELRFTLKIGGGDAKLAHLEEAYRSSIPVEGMVEKEIKGGFEVRIGGNVRAFCPFSQMGLQRGAPADFIGQRLPFRITQFAERGRNIIVSNRVLLEEERQEKRDSLRSSLQEGMLLKGTIRSLHDFGAFVDVGGVDGLIPVSEVGWGRVEDLREVLRVGQEVDVVVLKLDWEKNRLTFSMKGALPDPWDTIEDRFPPGSLHVGKIVRLTNFGAFVNVGEGIDGLLHISKLAKGKKIKHPREIVTEGLLLDVRIDSVDKPNKRLSLNLAESGTQEQESEEQEEFQKYSPEKSGSMGTLGEMLKLKSTAAQERGTGGTRRKKR